MAVGLAALQTVLDDSNVYDWFGSPYIVKLSLIAAITLGAFVVLEFFTAEPVANFRLLGRRNFGLGTRGNFLLGFALTLRPICCLSISPRLRGSMPSRAAGSWRGPDCRNSW